MTATDVYERIIWSADGKTPQQILDTLTRVNKPIAVKLDRLFHRRYGDELDATLRWRRSFRVFNDAKLVEIPSKLEELAKLEIELTRPWMLNCMAGCLSTGLAEGATEDEKDKIDGLKRFADVCNEADVKSCAVTVLTSKTDDIVSYEFGKRTPIEQVLKYVEKLAQFGFTDIVCSPQEAAAIRSDSRFDHMDLNCPGIRLAGGNNRDQARVMTPGKAVAAGVRRIVMGGPINDSDKPWEVIEAIAADIQSAA